VTARQMAGIRQCFACIAALPSGMVTGTYGRQIFLCANVFGKMREVLE
jgi:hypothetical protein